MAGSVTSVRRAACAVAKHVDLALDLSRELASVAISSALLITTTLVAFYSAFQNHQPPRRP